MFLLYKKEAVSKVILSGFKTNKNATHQMISGV